MFRLAAHLGMTVRRLLSELDSRELSEWLAYDRLEPLDDPYWRSGMVASTVANCMAGKKGEKFKPQDFLPRQKPQSAKQSKAIFENIIARQNIKVEKKDDI